MRRLLTTLVLIVSFGLLSSTFAASYKTIVNAALATKQLSTLVTALKAGDLVSALQGKGPFVVFAPTNKAFAALPEGTLKTLLKPENKSQLQAILKYHVISGNALKSAPTLEGHALMINPKNVDGARVVKMVKTGNGTVYVINKVLLPPKS